MKTDWIKTFKTEQEREEFTKSYGASKLLLDHMRKILQEYEASLDRSETNPEVFDQPNWAYKQAYKNGYRACLQKIKELITNDR